jgi:hypothetical protein
MGSGTVERRGRRQRAPDGTPTRRADRAITTAGGGLVGSKELVRGLGWRLAIGPVAGLGPMDNATSELFENC